MRIDVTQEYIDQGIPGDILSCPVALALNAYFGATFQVNKDYIVYEMRGKKKKSFFRTDYYYAERLRKSPKSVTRFIINYDIGGKDDPHVKPFSFEFDPWGNDE